MSFYLFNPHLLYRIVRWAGISTQKPVQHDEEGGRTPPERQQPFEQLLLRHERRHQHGVKVEPFAQHPGVVGQEKVVQHQMQRDAASLQWLKSGIVGWIVNVSEVGPLVCLATGGSAV